MVAPSAGISWQWPIIAAQTVVISFTIGALAIIFRPLIDNYLIGLFTRKKHEILILLNEWYSVPARDKQTLAIESQVARNAERLDEMDASFQRDFLRLAGSFKESLDNQTELVKQLTREQQTTSSKVDRILGRLENWDGINRRGNAGS